MTDSEKIAMPETWMPINDWPYEVSDAGNVRRARSGKRTRIGRPVKPQKHKGGYRRVVLWHNDERRYFYVHRLVAEAFLGPPPFAGAVCRHLNGHPLDNRPSNLCWGTQKDNIADRAAHGRTADGERCGASRLTAQSALTVRQSKEATSVLADRFGVNRTTIQSIRRGQTWKGL